MRRRAQSKHVDRRPVALVVALIGVYLGFTKSIPFQPPLRGQGGVREREQPPRPGRRCGSPASRSARSPRSSARTPGGDGAMVTMRINKTRAGRCTPTRPPRSARASSSRATSSSTSRRARRRRRSSHDGHVIPVNQTATPVQLDQVLTALQSDTREDLKTLLREYGKALKGKRRQGLQPLDPVLEARLPRLGDRRPTRCCGETGARPLRLHQERRRDRRARSTATASQLKALITDFNTTAGAFAREDDNLERRDRRAAAHAARRAARRSARSTRRSRPCARFAQRRCARASQSSGPTLDVALPLIHAAARPRLRARAARPRRRPAPDGPGARPARRRAACRSASEVRRVVELPERGHPAVEQGHGAGQAVPGQRARSTRRRRSRSRASPARAARVTPTASGSACSPPAAPTS